MVHIRINKLRTMIFVFVMNRGYRFAEARVFEEREPKNGFISFQDLISHRISMEYLLPNSTDRIFTRFPSSGTLLIRSHPIQP